MKKIEDITTNIIEKYSQATPTTTPTPNPNNLTPDQKAKLLEVIKAVHQIYAPIFRAFEGVEMNDWLGPKMDNLYKNLQNANFEITRTQVAPLINQLNSTLNGMGAKTSSALQLLQSLSEVQ